ncbi:hypothetical protein Hypma_015525 [Hypsizygus marmoreus]|uniref:Magnesium transporter NIPA8 n=1 Tax=Hypsizygus marmoreus TaxID=39966 RepID=A0A369K895_HYPMA|nr:hypothetical protein Hypma_015525 [Hypsizygus marmoreus]
MLHSSCRLVLRQAVLDRSLYTTHMSIPLGIFIGLLASFVQSLGLTIQRKSHVLNQLLPDEQQRVEHRRPLWLLGFAIFISSNVLGSLVQIASLPVVILAPLGAVSLLWNAFFARFILGDVFSPWMILGTILIAGGAVLIAVFGIVPEPTRSLEDLLTLFSRPAFVIYFSILGAAVLICLVITHITEYSFSRKLARVIPPSPSETCSVHPLTTRPATALTIGLSVPIADTGNATERTPLLDPKSTHSSPAPSFLKQSQDPTIQSINRTRLLLAISYASFSGIISGMCLLFAKSGVELLLLTLRGQNQFWRWQAWMLVLGLGVFALLQLWYLHKALVLADPTLVCPSAFCFYNLSSIVNGLVYFDQFSLIPPLHLGLVVLGIFVLLGGVWVVSIQSGSKEVDIETWSESDDMEEYMSGIEIESREVEERLPRTYPGPVPMERETRSESHIPDLTRSPESGVVDLESEVLSRQTTVSHPDRLSALLSPDRLHRISHRRRTTLDHGTYTSSSALSPPLLPSTLGGIQIGLSPVSPGFAIVPRERGRRVSGLGIGDGSTSQQRRRTVSEGDVGRSLAMAQDVREEGREDGAGEDGVLIGGGKGKRREGRRRWEWLRNMIRR